MLLLQATAEANYLSAINVCSRMYTREMEISSDTDGSFLVDSLLEDKHLREKNRALLEVRVPNIHWFKEYSIFSLPRNPFYFLCAV